ncbi:MAG: phage holin family protein [Microcella sp.]|uniref:phage holin family protein n=1 Tax=Microcella sp. TaxID=1913979 RepID=UPI0024C5F90F|nr:phage holin family protein [Microcella sp.]UYN83093.1 MAG: phage holin family protein [Microcella sp.]
MTDPDAATPRERRGLFALLTDIPGLIRELIAAEIESLKNEIIGKLKAAGIGAGFLVTAAAFAFFAVLVLTAAAVLALSLVLPGWAAALIVGGALLALAGIAAAIGIAQLKHGVPPTPTETIESVKEDVRVVRGIRK